MGILGKYAAKKEVRGRNLTTDRYLVQKFVEWSLSAMADSVHAGPDPGLA
jgi:hypothetical protein